MVCVMEPGAFLIIDHDLAAARTLQGFLRRLGHHVLGLAASGAEGIHRTSIVRPDLLFVNLRLQGKIDGIDTACHIHKRYGVPVIYIADRFNDGMLQRARAARPLGYLNRPLRVADVRGLLAVALDRSLSAASGLSAEPSASFGDGRQPNGDLQVLFQAVNRLCFGIFTLDRRMNIRLINQEGESILKDNGPLRKERGRLVCSCKRTNERLREMLDSRFEGKLALRYDDRSFLQLCLYPLRNVDYGLGDDDHRPTSICYLFYKNRSRVDLKPLFQQIYRLSQAEARVAAFFMDHHNIKKVAAHMFVSQETVRTHLKNIFYKTQTRSQVELAYRLTTGPAGTLLQ